MQLNHRSAGKVAVLFLSVVITIATVHAKVHLKIATTAAAMDQFNNWTTTISWQDISNYKNGNASRPVIDMVLQLQSLRAGGLDFDFELVRELTYELAKDEVIAGRANLSAESVWSPEVEANSATLLHSQPVLASGQFVKGVYGLPSNERLMKLSGPNDFKELTAVVVSTWNLDVSTVEALGPKGIIKTATPELAYAAIRKGQADFMLEEFPVTPDLHVTRGGVTLAPVRGYKVGLAASRSFIVSNKAADASAIAAALSAGLKILTDNGTVARAYAESGFFNAKVADWKLLN